MPIHVFRSMYVGVYAKARSINEKCAEADFTILETVDNYVGERGGKEVKPVGRVTALLVSLEIK